MKVGKAGKALAHAAYIARTGRYANRLRQGERMVAQEAGNMPAWAKADPLLFWEAADAHERSNGTTYREMEIALPRELSHKELKLLVGGWVRQEIGDRHAYQWAIHVPKAADGGDQPHVHLMFSERQVDGIERDPDVYFKRFNAKSPEKGGARKGYGPAAGQTLTAAERAAHLKDLRSRWEVACNKALAAAGQKKRIDMRSLKDRGIAREPEGKVLPSLWRAGGRDKIIELRTARAEFRADQAVLRAEITALTPIIEVANGRGNITVASVAGAPGRVASEGAPEMRSLRQGVLDDRRAERHDRHVPDLVPADVAAKRGPGSGDGLHQVPAPADPGEDLTGLPPPLRARVLARRAGWDPDGPSYLDQFRQMVPAARPQEPDVEKISPPVVVPSAPEMPMALRMRALAERAGWTSSGPTYLEQLRAQVPASQPSPDILPSRKIQQPPAAPVAARPAAPPLGAPQPVTGGWSPRDEASPERRTLMGSILDMTMTMARQPGHAVSIKPVLAEAWKMLGDLAPRFHAWLTAIIDRRQEPSAQAEIAEVSSWRKPFKDLRRQLEEEGRLPRSPGPRPPQKSGRDGQEP